MDDRVRAIADEYLSARSDDWRRLDDEHVTRDSAIEAIQAALATAEAASGAGDVFVVALALSKANGTTTTYSMSLTWRTGGTEQDAVDAAVLYAAKEKPGFGVCEKLVARIPTASLPPATDPAIGPGYVHPENVAEVAACVDLVRRMAGNSSLGRPFAEDEVIKFSSAHYEEARAITRMSIAAAPTIPATGHAATEGEGACHADRS